MTTPLDKFGQNQVLSRFRLQRALKNGFGIQYWGKNYTAHELSSAPHGVLIVEATRAGAGENGQPEEVFFDPIEIDDIRHGGDRPVLGYLNLAEIEPYRDYWVRCDRGTDTPHDLCTHQWLGPVTQTDEQLALYWHPKWEALLIERIDRMMSLGLDGVFFDDVLHYFSYASGQGLVWGSHVKNLSASKQGGFATAMMKLVIRLAERVRQIRPGAFVVVNNGVYLPTDSSAEIGVEKSEALFEEYVSSIDAIVVENIFGPKAAAGARQVLADRYLDRGVSVLTVDFGTQFPGRSTSLVRWMIGMRASALGFVSYVADNENFDRLYPPKSTLDSILMSP